MKKQNINRKATLYYQTGGKRSRQVRSVFIHTNTGWPVRRGNHVDPNPHAYEVFDSQGTGTIDLLYTDLNAQYNSSSPTGAISSIIVPYDQTAYNNALTDLYDSMRGGLDLSVDAFQARQTARMFSAQQQAEDLARGLKRSGIGKLRLIGSLWLQFQYGWRPTLASAYGVADESLRYVINKCSTYHGKGTTRSESVDLLGDGSRYFPAMRIDRTTVKIAVTVDNSQVINLSRWTSLNPASIGWELLPFSFVVDWFIDVGNTLRNAETALLYGRAFRSGYISTYNETKASAIAQTTDFPSGIEVISGNQHCHKRDFNRSLLLGMPGPMTPKLKFHLGSTQLLNAAGLLSQFLK